MADSNTIAVYDAVHKSKKQEKYSLPEHEIARSTLPHRFDCQVHDVRAEARPVPERNEAFDSDFSDNTYATLNETNGFTDTTKAIYTETTNLGLTEPTAEKTKKSRNEGTGCICVFVINAVVTIIILICLAILFAEVFKLKTQTASMQQSPLGQQTADKSNFVLQLQQINQSLSHINRSLSNVKDVLQMENIRLEGRLSDKLERRLNMSVGLLYQQLDQAYSTIDDNINQLNSSIEMHELSEGNSDDFEALNMSIQMVLLQFRQDIDSIEDKTQLIVNSLGQSQALPTPSCAALKAASSSLSGYYWVRASNGSAVRVYCDMTRSCGNVTGGWMRVAELDMTDNSQQCPSSLEQHTISSMRTCRINSFSAACSTVTSYRAALEYSMVCGKITAFQIHTTDSFGTHGDVRDPIPPLDGNYVDGVSLTRGNQTQHVWTFAAGSCSCSNGIPPGTDPPPFVGSDYFCDTRTQGVPLWHGTDCVNSNSCCSFNNPPWFYKQLPQPTTDDIEMRVCRDEPRSNEDVVVQGLEIYVQ